jgi:hypothetical protein
LWEFEAGCEPRRSSRFIQSLAWANGIIRPICGTPPVGQMADFVSDFDRLSFGTLRGPASSSDLDARQGLSRRESRAVVGKVPLVESAIVTNRSKTGFDSSAFALVMASATTTKMGDPIRRIQTGGWVLRTGYLVVRRLSFPSGLFVPRLPLADRNTRPIRK